MADLPASVGGQGVAAGGWGPDGLLLVGAELLEEKVWRGPTGAGWE